VVLTRYILGLSVKRVSVKKCEKPIESEILRDQNKLDSEASATVQCNVVSRTSYLSHLHGMGLAIVC